MVRITVNDEVMVILPVFTRPGLNSSLNSSNLSAKFLGLTNQRRLKGSLAKEFLHKQIKHLPVFFKIKIGRAHV